MMICWETYSELRAIVTKNGAEWVKGGRTFKRTGPGECEQAFLFAHPGHHRPVAMGVGELDDKIRDGEITAIYNVNEPK